MKIEVLKSERGAVLTSTQVNSIKHCRMIVNYDDRIRVVGTQPPALPRGMGRIFCGLTDWKELL